MKLVNTELAEFLTPEEQERVKELLKTEHKMVKSAFGVYDMLKDLKDLADTLKLACKK